MNIFRKYHGVTSPRLRCDGILKIAVLLRMVILCNHISSILQAMDVGLVTLDKYSQDWTFQKCVKSIVISLADMGCEPVKSIIFQTIGTCWYICVGVFPEQFNILTCDLYSGERFI